MRKDTGWPEMRGILRRIVFYVLCGGGAMTVASAQTITVPGKSNVFGAGHLTAPSPGGGTGGTLPPVISVAGGSLLSILATGTIAGDINKPSNGPDGGTQYSLTNVSSFGGISGIAHDSRTMFLVGVFVSNSEPSGAAPASLTYNLATAGLSNYSPLLNQTFFIGDGLTGTGSGTAQGFAVPAGATRLFFGFADSFNAGSQTLTGAPGFYGDNGGSLSVTISAVPEPSSVLTALALIGLIGWRERRNRCRATG